jgi:hypothetical protein
VGSVPGPDAPRGEDGAPRQDAPPETEFVPLPPNPPVGSTTPPGTGDLPPNAPPGFLPSFPPPDGPPGTPPGNPPGTPPGTPPGAPPGTPPLQPPPVVTTTSVVPEPAPLGMVLMGGGVLSLVAFGITRRS